MVMRRCGERKAGKWIACNKWITSGFPLPKLKTAAPLGLVVNALGAPNVYGCELPRLVL